MLDNQIDQLASLLDSGAVLNENELSKCQDLAIDCLRSIFQSMSDIFRSGEEPPKNIWGTIEKVTEYAAKADLAPKGMPWHHMELDEYQKNATSKLDEAMASAYYNNGFILGQLGMLELAREAYRKAACFEPANTNLVIWIHSNWALTINQINKQFKNIDPAKAIDSTVEFAEMIAHYEEIVQACEQLPQEDKEEYREAYENAKNMVKNATKVKVLNLRYSEEHDGQLIVGPFRPGGEAFLLRSTWKPVEQAESARQSVYLANVGLEFLQKGMLDEGIQELEKALELDPRNLPALVNIGSALQSEGRIREAVKNFEKALQLASSPEDLGMIHFNLGNSYKDQEDHSQAITHYQKSIAADPSKASRFYNVGQCYLAQMRFDEAIAAYEEALRLDPSHRGAKTSLEAVRMVKNSGMAEELQGASQTPEEILTESGQLKHSHAQTEKKSGCFIATAVYGSASSPEVLILQELRDNVLTKSRLGKIFVGIYYLFSPSLSEKLKDKALIRWILKILCIDPILRCYTFYKVGLPRNRI